MNELRDRYKPVVLDEIAYEGDIQHGWGNLTGGGNAKPIFGKLPAGAAIQATEKFK